MLVLSRKLNETILIGENVRVTLLGIEGDKIKIGIDAPRDIKIFREELVEATIDTNQQALAAPIVSFDLSKMKNPAMPKKAPDRLSTAVKSATRVAVAEKQSAQKAQTAQAAQNAQKTHKSKPKSGTKTSKTANGTNAQNKAK